MSVITRKARTAWNRYVLPRAEKWYLAPGDDLDSFFGELKHREVPYVVLRWFETLPHVDAGRDIDLLVDDAHLETVQSLLTRRPWAPGVQKFDVYSVGGLPESDYRSTPHFPPRFAQAVVDQAVWLRDRYRVPNPAHHFLTLAYHAVYHKGYASGLDSGAGEPRPRKSASHDYEAVLGKLAAEAGTPVPPTLDALDQHLDAAGLRPPLDTLERLASGNPWIVDRFLTDQPPVDPVWRGLSVFVLRDCAGDHIATAEDELTRHGFDVLETVRLSPQQRVQAAERVRGGNWGRGPWPRSGGDPCAFVVTYNVAPPPEPLDGHGSADPRVQKAKERLRRRLLQGTPVSEHYNPVHSSDHPRQALDYLMTLDDPELVERLRVRTERLVQATSFPFPIVRTLPSYARRAQVAVVDHPVHGQVVCKLFRPAASRFFERELRARTELADLPEVPELLEHGACWLLTPLYTDDRRHVRRPLPDSKEVQLVPSASRQLARLAADLHERGLFLLDLSGDNTIWDPRAGLKVLDFEFLQEYAEPRPAVAASYTFRGVPAGASHYDDPLRRSRPRAARWAFHPASTGMPVRHLLRPPFPGEGVAVRLVQDAFYVVLVVRAHWFALRSRPVAARVLSRLRAVGAVAQERAQRAVRAAH